MKRGPAADAYPERPVDLSLAGLSSGKCDCPVVHVQRAAGEAPRPLAGLRRFRFPVWCLQTRPVAKGMFGASDAVDRGTSRPIRWISFTISLRGVLPR